MDGWGSVEDWKGGKGKGQGQLVVSVKDGCLAVLLEGFLCLYKDWRRIEPGFLVPGWGNRGSYLCLWMINR